MPIGGKGYKVPKAGKVTDNPPIGQTGNSDGSSTEGGQNPFLPSAGSFSGRMNHSNKSGQSDSPTKTPYPFLPPGKK